MFDALWWFSSGFYSAFTVVFYSVGGFKWFWSGLVVVSGRNCDYILFLGVPFLGNERKTKKTMMFAYVEF